LDINKKVGSTFYELKKKRRGHADEGANPRVSKGKGGQSNWVAISGDGGGKSSLSANKHPTDTEQAEQINSSGRVGGFCRRD